MAQKSIHVYTDGSCHPNPGGFGGWAAVLVHPDGQEQTFLGSKESTTNNEMELLAAIHGLRQTPEGERVTICSDSSWLISCGSGYWQRHVYPELWAELDALRRARKVSWRKVKAHAGDSYNEKADELANLARRLVAGQNAGTA
jgi:ribonuclease HI